MCDRIMGSDAARAVDRFNPNGTIGYKAASAPDAEIRATRAEAVGDEHNWRDREVWVTPDGARFSSQLAAHMVGRFSVRLLGRDE